jgi:hypothetical protein
MEVTSKDLIVAAGSETGQPRGEIGRPIGGSTSPLADSIM